MSKRGYYRDPRLGGGAYREELERRDAADRKTITTLAQCRDRRLELKGWHVQDLEAIIKAGRPLGTRYGVIYDDVRYELSLRRAPRRPA